MKELILNILNNSISVKEKAVRSQTGMLLTLADKLAVCLTSGHKILIFGNGGSAADAQHLAAEFVNRFKIERPPLAALALTTDTSVITSIGNDYHYNEIFSKQIMALGQKGDIAVGISTSGNSPNVLEGLKAAKAGGLITVGMTGRGGKLMDTVDFALTVDAEDTARIQETHITMGHILCELVEKTLFPE